MKISKTVSAVGLVLAMAAAPGVAYAASPSPQMGQTGVGEGAGNAAGQVLGGEGGLSASTIVTGAVVVTAIGVAIAAATDDGDEIDDDTPQPPTTTTTTTTTTD